MPWSVTPPPPSENQNPPIPTIVGSFKAGCSRVAGRALWQRGYYEHIIRSEQELNEIRGYIQRNVDAWQL